MSPMSPLDGNQFPVLEADRNRIPSIIIAEPTLSPSRAPRQTSTYLEVEHDHRIPVQHVDSQRPVSVHAAAVQSLNLAQPVSTKRQSALAPAWKFPHGAQTSGPERSPSPELSPSEEEELFGLQSQSREHVEILNDYSGSNAYDYSPYKPARESVVSARSMPFARNSAYGDAAHYDAVGDSSLEEDDIVSPSSQRYEQKRISFIPVLDGPNGDLGARRY